ncbi:MAG: peptidoglycan-associated lipoprotein Pal [Desulfobacteraceae bacterium]|nr:MAG: peptidoglycan-associated lipoprotein Pal [Desulfobacteraceae bacterium]
MARKTFILLVALAFMSVPFYMGCAKKQVTQETNPTPAQTSTPAPGSTTQPGATSTPGSAPAPASGTTSTPTQAPAQTIKTADVFDLSTIYFDYDQSDLKAETLKNLEKKAEWLKKNPSAVVGIEGHCDERGTNEYNLALGDSRANAAKSYLRSLGIPAEKIHTISYGEERPADAGHSEAAWAKNRRAEFYLVK